jgi:fatty acid desaturase
MGKEYGMRTVLNAKQGREALVSDLRNLHTSTPPRPAFPIGEARRLVGDLFQAKRAIYWADFLVSLTVGYLCAGVYLTAPAFSLPQLLCYPIACALLYRIGSYMHEIVHFRRGEMTPFVVAWNILAGIPMLTPSFMYQSHIAHHNTHHYGTGNDGEYLPLGTGRLRNVIYFLLQIGFLPAYVVARFLFLVPLSFLHPRLRQWLLERASSFVINFRYRREIPENAPRHWWAAMDIACSLRAWAILGFVLVGLNDWTRMPMLYSIAVMTLGMNHLRTLVAHRYQSTGERMSHVDQLSDSINVSGGWLTEIMFPLGMRYHALHHLFPSLPYHNLGKAHRRLMKGLPADSEYHEVTHPHFVSAFQELLRNCRGAGQHPVPPAEQWYAKRRAAVRR